MLLMTARRPQRAFSLTQRYELRPQRFPVLRNGRFFETIRRQVSVRLG